MIPGDVLEGGGPSEEELGMVVLMPTPQEGLDRRAFGRQVSN